MKGITNHRDTEARSKLLHEELTEKLIGAAIEVHHVLRPGLCLYPDAWGHCRKGDLEFLRDSVSPW